MPAHPADHPGPFALVADLDAPRLATADAHHLSRVLRLRSGDPLVLGDGAGRWRPARFGEPPEPTAPIVVAAPEAPEITVGFALVKGDRPELVVQKLTELGVDRIIPFRAARSVVRWDEDRAERAVVRLRAVARAAAQQAHRPWLPQVEEVADFDDLLTLPGAALADRSGGPPSLDHRVVLVGPEGGWAPEESAAAVRASLPKVAIGLHVLRAETAAVTVGALLTGLRAGIVTRNLGG
ncbi:MAG: RsmE family RNA methyltransferase [Acidimicrobiales bacterium]